MSNYIVETESGAISKEPADMTEAELRFWAAHGDSEADEGALAEWFDRKHAVAEADGLMTSEEWASRLSEKLAAGVSSK